MSLNVANVTRLPFSAENRYCEKMSKPKCASIRN